ncbi:MAG: hypothetical protein J6R85_02515, partial [Lentisphaeria bacterium]|nr:hypothetical protein [Lentisphaeria bacterium]
KTRQSARRRQRGVALLLALGVLSLLMVTGLAFVSNSMLARKSAANFRCRAQAKMIADSTINRIMLQLKYYMHDGQSTHFDNLISKNTHADGSNNDVFRDEIPSLLTGTVDGVNYSAGSNVEWFFLYDIYKNGEIVTGEDDDTKNSRIIGRSAYTAVPAAANVNFSEVLRGHPDVVGSSNSASSWEKRRGVSIRELNFGVDQFNDIDGSLDALAERFKNNEDFENKVEELDKDYSKRDYQSFDEIAAAVDLPAAWNRNLRRYMLASGYNDAEIFAVDTGANTNSKGFTGNAKFYHRFNLLRDDWNSLTVSDLFGNAKEFDFEEADQPDDDDIKSIPWLRFIHDDKGNYPSLEARRRQVAANLLAYCSPAGRNTIAGKGVGASHNVLTSANDWWDQVPEYTGNKKTFYINEITVAPTENIIRTNDIDLGPPRKITANYEGSVSIGGIGVEVVNMYGISTGDMKVRIAGEATVAVTLPGGSKESVVLDFDTNGTVDLPLTWNGIYGYGVMLPTGATPLTPTQLENPRGTEKPEIELIGLKVDKVMLCDASGNPVDFVRTLEKNNFNI